MIGNFRQLLRTTRALHEARTILDMLAYRLRDEGPEMTRAEIRERVTAAAEKVCEVVPRSPLRNEN